MSRGPGRLEVETTGDAVDIQHLTGEVKTGNHRAAHRPRVDLPKVHATGRNEFFFEGGLSSHRVAVVRQQVDQPVPILHSNGAPTARRIDARLGQLRAPTLVIMGAQDPDFGDPEAEVILPLVEHGLTGLLDAAARGEPLPQVTLRDAAAVTTVLASRGYPESSSKGDPITLPDTLPDGVTVYHAGTRQTDAGLVTAGGRVLAVTAVAPTFAAAQERSRATAEAIAFEGKQFRRDIGYREAARSEP